MAKNSSPIEKRRHIRLDYSRLISFTHYADDSQVQIPGKMAAIKDVSEAGILIQTAELLESGDVLDLDIAFEQDKIVQTQGTVVHSRKAAEPGLFDTGVTFSKIDKADLAYLKKFVELKRQH